MTTELPPGTLIERLQPVKAIRVYFRQSLEEEQQRFHEGERRAPRSSDGRGNQVAESHEARRESAS